MREGCRRAARRAGCLRRNLRKAWSRASRIYSCHRLVWCAQGANHTAKFLTSFFDSVSGIKPEGGAKGAKRSTGASASRDKKRKDRSGSVDSGSTVEKKGSPRALSMSAASSVSSDEVSGRRKAEIRALSSRGHEGGPRGGARSFAYTAGAQGALATICD